MSKVLVLGKGKSGQSAKILLEKLGYKVIIKNTDEIECVEDRFLRSLSFICLSPGISINSRIIRRAKELNVEVCGELELGHQYLACKTIAITGTNGKTTTTTLVGELCNTLTKTYVGGNIGNPVTSFCIDSKVNDLCVLEVSSFQAESFSNFNPHVGVFLNFDDDHLDRHGNRENYFKAKMNMFSRQTNKDYAVINYDDLTLRQKFLNVKSKVYYFSLKSKVKGCYTSNGCIYFNNGETQTKICTLPNNIQGNHNIQNVLAAVTVAKIIGVSDMDIEKVLLKFKVTNHRLEEVATVKTVTFINDSKSTNVASTLAAIGSLKRKIVLIVGGSDKGCDFNGLFKFPSKKVIAVIAIGQTGDKIIKSAKARGYKNVYKMKTLDGAVRMAYSKAVKGSVVLLSPACASFDMFANYEDRGKKFKSAVLEIVNENIENAGDKET